VDHKIAPLSLEGYSKVGKNNVAISDREIAANVWKGYRYNPRKVPKKMCARREEVKC